MSLNKFFKCWLCNLLVILSLILPQTAKATPFLSHKIISSPVYAAIVINATTSEVLYSKNSKELRHPASLTKVMTLYLLFEAIEKGKLQLSQRITISPAASAQPRLNLNLKVGSTISVKDAIYGLIVRSANDVSHAIAEALGGGVEKFAIMMNNKAKQLGLRDTYFVNPHGLHHEGQVTTAYDMAKLALAMQSHFPKYYHLFSIPSFKFQGRIIKGHNNVLRLLKGADGLKTGFTNASGFNLITSARGRQGRLVGVVLGGQTSKVRDLHMVHLLQAAYTRGRTPRANSLPSIIPAIYQSNVYQKNVSNNGIYAILGPKYSKQRKVNLTISTRKSSSTAKKSLTMLTNKQKASIKVLKKSNSKTVAVKNLKAPAKLAKNKKLK